MTNGSLVRNRRANGFDDELAQCASVQWQWELRTTPRRSWPHRLSRTSRFSNWLWCILAVETSSQQHGLIFGTNIQRPEPAGCVMPRKPDPSEDNCPVCSKWPPASRPTMRHAIADLPLEEEPISICDEYLMMFWRNVCLPLFRRDQRSPRLIENSRRLSPDPGSRR